MYGFIHCCLEDMVLQLFGEAAWREILNNAGIKLRGASFLMHQVYDDETTFKLVVAASNVSGLPMEVCLEEFGKHFLVYCQKNGYDQILRVLGSNLYDFLTNLDNLHDHLASIYPGMRAPSFRVTRQLNTNNNNNGSSSSKNNGALSDDSSRRKQGGRESSANERETKDLDDSNDLDDDDDEMAKQHRTSLASGSMYLHYYSERKGLSPIVKGLVMAVAKEFFSTDIIVTECRLLKPQFGHADDHVVLKIDRRSQANILLDTAGVGAGLELGASPVADPSPASSPATAEPASQATATTAGPQHQNQQQQQQQPQKTMLSAAYGDSLSKLPADSLVNSEIMMQTFPFHVIFDRHFNLVQVGKSLLRVTSFYWQRRQQQQAGQQQAQEQVKFCDLFSIVRPKIEFTFDAIADHTNQVFVVKTRPLVLNADYLRSLGLGPAGSAADAASDAAGGDPSSSPSAAARGDRPRHRQSVAAPQQQQPTNQPKQQQQQPFRCPMDRMAAARRSTLASTQLLGAAGGGADADADAKTDRDQIAAHSAEADGGAAAEAVETGANSADSTAAAAAAAQTDHHQLDSSGPADGQLSLRLKGQMIILAADGQLDLAPSGGGGGDLSTNQGGSPPTTTTSAKATASATAGPYCLYLCSPRVDHLNQLMECGVRMSDLALHDRARELMLMSHTHKEDREAVKKLDQATNDLKKMDTKLRQENKRTNEVLHNIFPAKIAALLSHGRRVESESFDLVTCLYSDIIGFTKMCGSENVRPIDIVRLLNTLYLQFDNLTNIHGVFKVETIGDAYVIVGGLPEPAEDHADRCVKMGLDMVKVIGTVRSPADGLPIQMRIGIHSGPVMAGIVGIRVPRYSLFGNTTTLANQLETNGVGGKIHISDFTLKNLIQRDKFVIEDNPNQINGIPFQTYFVSNYLSDEKEALKHERILEEQLIKDFELMGNMEVELVDDESAFQAQPQPRVQVQPQSQQPVAADHQTHLATHLVDTRQVVLQQTTSGAPLSEPMIERRQQHTLIGQRRPLAEAALTSATGEGGPQLLLMDVEASGDARRHLGDQLVDLSSELTCLVVGEALKQVAQVDELKRLLGYLFSVQQQQQPTSAAAAPTTATATAQAAPSDQLACPLCDGNGTLWRASWPDQTASASSLLLLLLEQIRLVATTGRSCGHCLQMAAANGRPASGQRPTGGPVEGDQLTTLLPGSGGGKLMEASSGGANRAIALGHGAGLEQLLADLRLEQGKLGEKVDRLAAQLGATAAAAAANGQHPPSGTKTTAPNGPQSAAAAAVVVVGATNTTTTTTTALPSSRQQQQQQEQLATGGELFRSNPTVVCSPGGRPLSSNIQRMKRMDTLKRRKMKREQQLQHQFDSPQMTDDTTDELRSAGPTTPSWPLEMSGAHQGAPTGAEFGSIRFGARPAASSNGGQTPLAAGACPLRSVQGHHHHQRQVSGRLDETEELEDDEDDGDEDDKEMDKEQVDLVSPGAAAAAAGQRLAQRDIPPTPQIAPAPPGGQLPTTTTATATTTRATYVSSFRASLANLMGEAIGQATGGGGPTGGRQTSPRKRFSLSGFGSTISALASGQSPFSSPKRTPGVVTCASQQTVMTGAPRPPPRPADSGRKPSGSSRSQSSSSGGNLTASSGGQSQQSSGQPRAASTTTNNNSNNNNNGQSAPTNHAPPTRKQAATNCSCLKSSGSSQSIGSLDRAVK